jgi:hypothetical protein
VEEVMDVLSISICIAVSFLSGAVTYALGFRSGLAKASRLNPPAQLPIVAALPALPAAIPEPKKEEIPLLPASSPFREPAIMETMPPARQSVKFEDLPLPEQARLKGYRALSVNGDEKVLLSPVERWVFLKDEGKRLSLDCEEDRKNLSGGGKDLSVITPIPDAAGRGYLNFTGLRDRSAKHQARCSDCQTTSWPVVALLSRDQAAFKHELVGVFCSTCGSGFLQKEHPAANLREILSRKLAEAKSFSKIRLDTDSSK